jgi:SAM-dependent methyltransferase
VYDAVACISTLEHVGCDNFAYTQKSVYVENQPDEFVVVMRELHRVLRPGGVLLLTVPFGVHRLFPGFQQFDAATLDCALEAFGPAQIDASYYRYHADGWQVASREQCATCEYVDWITQPRSAWPSPIRVEPDGAAAARAVACVRITARSASDGLSINADDERKDTDRALALPALMEE